MFEKTGERTVNLSNADVGPRYSFWGIYSSRIKESETKEPIYGICWTKAAIESVCESQVIQRDYHADGRFLYHGRPIEFHTRLQSQPVVFARQREN